MSTSFDPEALRAFEHARWERAAPVFAASFATATGQFVEVLLDAAAVRARTRVLDVACGSGVAAAEAAARGAVATGVDFSPAMLEVARAAHPGIGFVQGDAEALPCADASFDAVVANFGIHHVPRPPLALAQAFRVLGAGGRDRSQLLGGAGAEHRMAPAVRRGRPARPCSGVRRSRAGGWVRLGAADPGHAECGRVRVAPGAA